MDKDSYNFLNNIEDRHWWFVVRREILLKIYRAAYAPIFVLPIREDILDIGCGNGGNLECLEQLGVVTGLEYEENAVDNFRAAHPSGTVYHGFLPDGVPEKLEQQRFSLITMLDVLEHIEDEKSALAKAIQMLSQDGKIMVTVPAYNWLWTKGDELAWHKRRYTKKRLNAVLEEMGLDVVYSSYFNTVLFPAEALVRLISKFIPNYNASVELNISPINGIFKALFRLEKLVIPNFSLPFGLSIVVAAVKRSDI